MSSSTTDLSSGLRPDEDLPLMDNHGIELFNEGMYFFGVDHATTTAFWLAMHPTAYDFGLVREMVGFFLPDGRIGLAKAFGRGRAPTTQAAANLSFECIEPFAAWRLCYDAAVQIVPQDDTLAGRLEDGRYVPARIDVDVTSATPLWVLGTRPGTPADAARNEYGYIGHYNQHFTFTGELSIDGQTRPIAGNGIRDHSRGKRDYSSVQGHHFVLGRTDSGRAFGLLRVQRMDGEERRPGYIVEDGRMHHAEIVDITPVRITGSGEAIRIELTSDLGRSVVVGETLGSAGWMMYPPHDVVYGIDLADKHGVPLLHSPLKFTLDGEPGFGLYERSLRHP